MSDRRHERSQYPFIIRRSRIQGRGAFATRRIRKGECIIEYAGERISNKEADKRYDDTRMGRHHTYLFTLTQRTVVDGAVNGAGTLVRLGASKLRLLQSGYVRNYALGVAGGAVVLVGWVLLRGV